MRDLWKMLIPVKFISTKDQKTQTRIEFAAKKEDFEKLEWLQVEQAKGSHGYLFFSPDILKKEVEEAMKNKKIGINYDGRSDSEEVRGILRELWDLLPTQIPFEEFYHSTMEKIKAHFRKKIRELR